MILPLLLPSLNDFIKNLVSRLTNSQEDFVIGKPLVDTNLL